MDIFRAILCKMGYSEKWVNLILQCVSSVSYTMSHPSGDIGPIAPSRGLRQGDPLSPYLFIMRAQGLSDLIHDYERRKLIKGIKVCNQAPASHTWFSLMTVICIAMQVMWRLRT